jgi:chromosome segregation ATPase
MADNNTTLRTTTISLDEYNRLQDEAKLLRESKGALQTTISNLTEKVNELKETQPKIKVVHFTSEMDRDYDDWNDDYETHPYLKQSKVEFINLTEVQALAKAEAKEEVKQSIEVLENLKSNNEITEKNIRRMWTETSDQLEDKKKELRKIEKKNKEDLDEKSETYNKNVDELKKAYKEDEKNYKETIKDLKEEVQKVKDNKTDKEIEGKRNQEIKDLKGRIKDLETMVEDLGKLNFFKRVFKLRAISAEKLAAEVELTKRERNANAVGTTWVSEGGKYRKYNSFSELLNSMYRTVTDPFVHYFNSNVSYFTGTSNW